MPQKAEFMFLRCEDTNNKPVAYLVIYPDKDGNLCLRYGIKRARGTSVPETFLSKIEELKTKCPGRIREDKKFDPRPYEQIHIMWAGAIFQEELQITQGKLLPAFINTKKELSQYGEVGGRNLEEVLTDFGYHVSYINSCCKLYQHYLGLGLDLAERFGELLKSQPELRAFISLLEEARKKDPAFKLLGDTNLEGVLTGFGYDVSYISSHYKLYQHYLGLDLNLAIEFGDLLKSQSELRAFISLLEKARKTGPPFELLGDTNLQGVLTGFGYDVSYISSQYRIYTYWKSKGIEVDKEYTFSDYDKDEFQRVFSGVEKLGLPEGNFSFPVGYYLFEILIRLGKFPKDRTISIGEFSEDFISSRGTGLPSPERTAIIAVDIDLLRKKANGRVDRALALFSEESLDEEKAAELATIIAELKSMAAGQPETPVSPPNNGTGVYTIPINGSSRQGI